MFRVVIIGKAGASHHWDYCRFLKHYYPDALYFSGRFSQLIGYFTLNRLILLDFEYKSFKFFPLVILRNLLFLKTDIYAVSIANWALNKPRVGRQLIIKWHLKRKVFRFLSKKDRVGLYYTSEQQDIREFYNSTYVDFQYWDLKHLRDDKSFEAFSERFNEVDIKATMIYIGRFHRYRGAELLYFLCNEYDELPFLLIVWSGNIENEFKELVRDRKDVMIIDTMPSSSDIINTHFYFKNILLYYPFSKRTSGYFGRGVQTGNYLYVSPKFHMPDDFVYPRIVKFNKTQELFAKFAANQDKSYSQNMLCEYNHEVN